MNRSVFCEDTLTQSFSRQQLLLALFATRQNLFLLDTPSLVLRDRLIEFLAQLMKYPEALFDLKRIYVLTEEFRERSSHSLELLHISLQLCHFSFGHLRISTKSFVHFLLSFLKIFISYCIYLYNTK